MQVWGQSCPFDCFFFERFDDFALGLPSQLLDKTAILRYFNHIFLSASLCRSMILSAKAMNHNWKMIVDSRQAG
jgi:hypothetical protein